MALENQLEHTCDSQQADDKDGDNDPHQDFHAFPLSKFMGRIAWLLKRQRFD
jgi:hypothetical protein